jgi:hypothetical protein
VHRLDNCGFPSFIGFPTGKMTMQYANIANFQLESNSSKNLPDKTGRKIGVFLLTVIQNQVLGQTELSYTV